MRPLRAGLLYSRHDKNTIAIVVLVGIKLCRIARDVLNDHLSHHNINICIISGQYGQNIFLEYLSFMARALWMKGIAASSTRNKTNENLLTNGKLFGKI